MYTLRVNEVGTYADIQMNINMLCHSNRKIDRYSNRCRERHTERHTDTYIDIVENICIDK